MKFKVSWIAWILWAAICLAVIIDVVNGLLKPEHGFTLFEIVAFQILGSFIPVVFATVDALVISRQPRNLVGWLIFAPAVSVGVTPVLEDFINLTSMPAQLNLGDYLWIWYRGWEWILAIFPIFLIILLFPTGRPPSPRWNWVAYLALGMVGIMLTLGLFVDTLEVNGTELLIPNPIGFLPSSGVDTFFLPIWLIGLLVLTVSSVVSIIIRYNKSTALERQQIKWLLYACGVFGVLYAFTVLSVFVYGNDVWDPNIFTLILFSASMGIPISIVIAILRYRLWDIDVIIRKTLVYGLLTTALALLYFGLVTLMQTISSSVFGLRSPVIIVLTTLVIAALFNPLRNRIQSAIDRRFYRQKYNAAKALVQFAEAARNETDIKCLTTAMLDVVQETVHPETISLWVRKPR